MSLSSETQILLLRKSGFTQCEVADITGTSQHIVRKVERRARPEKYYRDKWVEKLSGRPGPRLTVGVPDIITNTHVYEIKEVNRWKAAFGQVKIYALELGLKPTVILFGRKPGNLEAIESSAKSLSVGLRFDWEAQALSPFDLRLKIPLDTRETIVRRARGGESQERIAADFGVSQARVSQIIRSHAQRKV